MATELMITEIEPPDNQSQKKSYISFKTDWLNELVETELPKSTGRQTAKFGDIFIYHSDRDEVWCQICEQAGAQNDFSMGKHLDEWKMDYLRRHLNNGSHLDSVLKLRQQISLDMQSILNGLNGSASVQNGLGKSHATLSKESSSGLYDSERLERGFKSLISRAHPKHLHTFFVWLDLKLAEYKIYGQFIPETDYENTWLQNGSAKLKERGEVSRISRPSDSFHLHLTNTVPKPLNDYYSDGSVDMDEELFCNGSMFTNTSSECDKSLSCDKLKKNVNSERLNISNHISQSEDDNHVQNNFNNDKGNNDISQNKSDLAAHQSGEISLHEKELGQDLKSSCSDTSSIEKYFHQNFNKNGINANALVLGDSKFGGLNKRSGGISKRLTETAGGISNSRLTDRLPKPADKIYKRISEIKNERDCSGKIPESVLNHQEVGDFPESVALHSEMGGLRMIPSHTSSDYRRSVCPYCSKVFQYRSSYRRHVKVHEGVFSHECLVCGRKFARKEHYRRHKCSRRSNKLVFAPSMNPTDQDTSLPLEFLTPSHLQRLLAAEDSVLNLSGQSSPLSDSLCSSSTPRSDQQGYDETLDSTDLPGKYLDGSGGHPRMVGNGRHGRPVIRPILQTPRKEQQSSEESLGISDQQLGIRNKPGQNLDASDAPGRYCERNGEFGTGSNIKPINESRRKSSTPRKIGTMPEFGESLPGDEIIEADGLRPDCNRGVDSEKCQIDGEIKKELDWSDGDLTHEISSKNGKKLVDGPSEKPDNALCRLSEEKTDLLNYREDGEAHDLLNYQIDVDVSSGAVSTSRKPTGRLGKDAVIAEDGSVIFECPHCFKKFYRSSNFSRHMRIHRGVYSYICTVCSRGFFRREHYTKHKCHRLSHGINGQ